MSQGADVAYTFRPLVRTLWRGAFSCGVRELDGWFIKKAWDHHDKLRGRVTTIHSSVDDTLVGFYAICITLEEDRLLDKNSHLKRFAIGRHFPALQVQYLAVQREFQENGIGTIAMGKIIDTFRQVALMTGVPVMTLTALNSRAARLYSTWGFVPYGGFGSLRMLLPSQSVFALDPTD